MLTGCSGMALLNIRWIDCRWVLAAGAVLLMNACLLGMQITSDWTRQNFWTLQV
nr:EmrB/QacA family drug resistance transporter [Candidatus Pantoea persica]